MTREKEFRTKLFQHLFHKHGEFTSRQGDKFTVEDLERIHEIFHKDEYACPPHTHLDSESGYDLGELEFSLGENYIEEVADHIKGD